MGTTIDSLQIEIQTSSSNAAGGIDALAKSLERLKKVGSLNTVVKSLSGLSAALQGMQTSSAVSSNLQTLATAIESLKKAGSFGSIGSSIEKLGTALTSLQSINVESVAPQIKKIAEAVAPLSNVKAGGLNSMMSGLQKLGEVTKSLDDATIAEFVSRVKKLDQELGPLSKKMSTVATAFNAAKSSSKSASDSIGGLGKKVNTTTLNMSNMINVIRSVVSALRPVVNLIKKSIGDAIEWEGIAQRFGRGFGDQADEVYSWIQELNKEMGINTQQFMQYSSTYATMLKGFGVASKDASKMALGYMELTYDVWSGYNDIYKSLDDAATAIRSAIAGEVEPVRKAGFTIIESTLEQTAANHGLKISLEKATESTKSYLRYLTLVDQAKAQGLIGNYAREMNTAEGVMRTFNQQLKSLGQTFGSIFLPILVRVMPWFQAFIDLVGDAIMAVAAFFNIDIQKVDWGNNITDPADDATDSVNKTTDAMKKLKNATTGIDELNIISPQSSKSSSSDPGSDYDWDVDSLWDKSIFDSIQFEVDAIKEKLKEALSGIEAMVGGFALAIGAILVLSGNPKTLALGIGLLAVGAVGLAHSIAANWDGMSEQLAKTLTMITGTLGGFLLALGAMLTFTGAAVPLGIGLMVAGAASLGTAVSINWKFLEGDLKNTLSILTAIVSGGALALGAVLAFSGANIGLGIALMAAGAIGIVTAAALNWDSLTEPTRKAIGTIGAIAGSSLLAIGLIMCLTGGALPIGIGLMAAGAVSIVSAVALNWDSLTGDIKNTLTTIGTIVGGALLGVGAVLAFTGVATGIGIAMIAAGAVSIVASAAINWDWIVGKIKNVLKNIGMAAGAALLALGVLLVCTGVALPTGIALMAAGAASLITGAALNSDSATTQVKNKLTAISLIAGASLLALGVILVCSGVALPVGIALIAAGASGLVSAVTLNWDSIKTSVQTAFNKIKDWVSTYGLLALGVILCITGVGAATGVGLINQALNKKTGNGTTFGDDLLKTIKEKWNAVKEWWNSKPALKEISTKVASIKEKVSDAWSSAQTWWNEKKTALKSYTPSIGSIKDKLSSAWDSAKKWWNDNVKLSIPSLSFKVTYTTKGLNALQKGIVKALGLEGWPKLSFAANGGIFDAGSLVWAGESGPEVLANAGGGKTGVMNVQQMSEAVYEGVYSAVVAAMRAGGGNGGAQSVNVYLDGKQITSSVEQRQKERGASLMGSQVYAY